jgi:hypothetical protein
MSHPINDMILENAFDEGLELAEAKGLKGEEAEVFAEKFAHEKLEELSI